MSFASPLVRLCRVWVDLDGSVAVSNGCIWSLQLDEDTEYRGCSGYQSVGEKKNPTYFQKFDTSVTNTDITGFSPRPLSIKNRLTGVQLDGLGKKIQSLLQLT